MQTLKLKQILSALLLITGVSTATAAEIPSKADADSHHGGHTLEWPGVYNGFTPCADCTGVKTSLALNTNNTYILITINIGKSLREYTEKGKFTWGEKPNTIILTPKSGTSVHQYLVGENTLTELDSNGNRYTGKNAESYTLRRIDVTAIDKKHSH